MDTRIERGPVGTPPVRRRTGPGGGERRFTLPRGRGPSDEPQDEDVVLEPAPRRRQDSLPVSRTRLEDEAGQRIDVQG